MIHREVAGKTVQLAPQYPVITVTGPRQSGKTTLCLNLAIVELAAYTRRMTFRYSPSMREDIHAVDTVRSTGFKFWEVIMAQCIINHTILMETKI